MSTREEMLVIKRGYDLSKWLLDHTGKFPKSYRFSVAAKIENAILDFVEMSTVANMRQDKLPLLRRADEALARLRLLFRLSYEMRFINLTSYEYGSGKLDRSRSAGQYGGAPGITPQFLVGEAWPAGFVNRGRTLSQPIALAAELGMLCPFFA